MSKKPTATERVLFGPNGCPDKRSAYYLERYLLSMEKLNERLGEMPPPLKAQMDKWNDPEFDIWSQGCSIGMGHSPDVGWFILGSGQGPFVIWIEGDPYFGELDKVEDAYDFWKRVKKGNAD